MRGDVMQLGLGNYTMRVMEGFEVAIGSDSGNTNFRDSRAVIKQTTIVV